MKRREGWEPDEEGRDLNNLKNLIFSRTHLERDVQLWAVEQGGWREPQYRKKWGWPSLALTESSSPIQYIGSK